MERAAQSEMYITVMVTTDRGQYRQHGNDKVWYSMAVCVDNVT
jgi:hypothetical protein